MKDKWGTSRKRKVLVINQLELKQERTYVEELHRSGFGLIFNRLPVADMAPFCKQNRMPIKGPEERCIKGQN